MLELPLNIFTSDEPYPFFIQFGKHDSPLCQHGHADFVEMTIVRDGNAIHQVGEQRYEIQRGDVFVIARGENHGFPEANGLRICNLMFRPEDVFPSNMDIIATEGFKTLFQENRVEAVFTRKLHLSGEDYAVINQLLEKMYREYTSQMEGWRTVEQGYLTELAVFLSRRVTAEQNHTQPQGWEQLSVAMEYLEENFATTITVSELAKLSHYSERQFLRLFQNIYHCNPMTYLIRLRLQRAKELLQASDFSISEISQQCGYEDCNYFSRLFRQKNGVTPSAYRSITKTAI